jgi:peptide/nickel transport system ATP-binding protein/oligopeptide transport system ATP-binding protein
MAETLLAVAGLAKEYRVGTTLVRALREVDLEIERGACVAIVGESGSGKTTLGKLVLGIEPPTRGRILFAGRELPAPRTRADRRAIQFVQQNPMSALNPKRSIYDSVGLPLAVHGLVPRARRRARVAELLELVGMSPEYLDRTPLALSGGQRQRIALARALAAEPELVVLDEPTSSLDVSVQARVLELLVGLQQRLGLTYVFITHDLSVVRNVASRVAVLYRGRIVETGATAAVFAKPAHRYTQMLLSSIPVVTEAEQAIKPTWPWERDLAAGDRVAEAGCAFSPRCPYVQDACRTLAHTLRARAAGHAHACYNPA